jgi:ribose transport system ATP-binding protein
LSVIYISHRVEEILKIGDRVAILREGRKIAAIEAKEADWDEIVRLVMGREFPNKYPRRAARASGEALRMGGKDAGELGLRGGEILGVAVRGRARRAGLIRGTYGSDPCGSAKTLLKMMNVNQKAA